MNVYLDIDNTLKGTKSPHADVEAFLEYVLDNFSGHVFWLTTHCKHGSNFAIEAMCGAVSDGMLGRLGEEVRGADWGVYKTDGIDFSTPFVWFDDTVFDGEWRILEEHGATDSVYVCDSKDPDDAKNMLKFLKSLSYLS